MVLSVFKINMIFLSLPVSLKTLKRKIIIFDKKRIWKRAQIFLSPGGAKVSPPVSSILGQFGINLLEFCEKFNTSTKNFDPELVLSVSVVVYYNKSFRFIIKPIFSNEVCFWLNSENLKITTDINSNFVINFYKFYLIYLESRDILEDREVNHREIIKMLLAYLSSFNQNK